MKLSQYATKASTLDAYRTSTGMVVMHDPQLERSTTKRFAPHAPVSSAHQNSDVERRVQSLRDYADSPGAQVAKQLTEIAARLNESRPKFSKLLVDPISTITGCATRITCRRGNEQRDQRTFYALSTS